MEVSGARRRSTMSDSSNHANNSNPCDQCEEVAQFVLASGFCQTCNDFLCSDCINQHKTFRGTKNHRLLGGDDIPHQRPTPTDVERCSVHPDRAVEMYCSDEDILGCTMCFFEGHRNCQNVDKVSNLSKNIAFSEEIEEILGASKKKKDVSSTYRDIVQNLRSKNDHCHSKCIGDYQSFQKDMTNMLTELKGRLSKRVDNVHKENNDKLDKLTEQILLYEQQVESLIEIINGQLSHEDSQRVQLFILVKKNKKHITNSVQKIEQLGEELYIDEFNLSYDPSVKEVLRSDSIVRVETAKTSMGVGHVSVENDSTVCVSVDFLPQASSSNGSVQEDSLVKAQTRITKPVAFNRKLSEVGDTNKKAETERLPLFTCQHSEEQETKENTETATPLASKCKHSENQHKNERFAIEKTPHATKNKPSDDQDSMVRVETAKTSMGVGHVSVENDSNVCVEDISPLVTADHALFENAHNVSVKYLLKPASSSDDSMQKNTNLNAQTQMTTPVKLKFNFSEDGNTIQEAATETSSVSECNHSHSEAHDTNRRSETGTSPSSKCEHRNERIETDSPPASECKRSEEHHKDNKDMFETEQTPPVSKSEPSDDQSNKGETKYSNIRTVEPAIFYFHKSWISIASDKDENDCTISSIVAISPSKLILADCKNFCLKLVDTDSEVVITRKALNVKPHDLTLLHKSRVAVSIPNQREIRIYTADENLNFCKTLNVVHKCKAIHCTGDRLLVSFIWPKIFQILDLQGNVIRTIRNYSDGESFCYLEYITLNPEYKLIYFTDNDADSLTCMNLNGVVQWIYRNKRLQCPKGVALGDGGCIYVCSRNTHTIHVVSSEGSILHIIPKQIVDIRNPLNLTYSAYHRALYVSSECSDTEECEVIGILSLR